MWWYVRQRLYTGEYMVVCAAVPVHIEGICQLLPLTHYNLLWLAWADQSCRAYFYFPYCSMRSIWPILNIQYKNYWTIISIVHIRSVDKNCPVEAVEGRDDCFVEAAQARDGRGDHTPTFSSLWQARPWPRHTDESNGPATYETSFSEGERATITTLFDCGSLENRNSLENLASAEVRMGSMLCRRIWRRLSRNKTHIVRPIVLYMTYGNTGCGLETHTALGCAWCCMSLETTPLVPINHV